ncbi:MAG: hypothetical protein VX255_15720 [Candidatus Latescibacterota bacterium]|nr:hypothetical protein [Candidatus Latescibacterota bacterium]
MSGIIGSLVRPVQAIFSCLVGGDQKDVRAIGHNRLHGEDTRRRRSALNECTLTVRGKSWPRVALQVASALSRRIE